MFKYIHHSVNGRFQYFDSHNVSDCWMVCYSDLHLITGLNCVCYSNCGLITDKYVCYSNGRNLKQPYHATLASDYRTSVVRYLNGSIIWMAINWMVTVCIIWLYFSNNQIDIHTMAFHIVKYVLLNHSINI